MINPTLQKLNEEIDKAAAKLADEINEKVLNKIANRMINPWEPTQEEVDWLEGEILKKEIESFGGNVLSIVNYEYFCEDCNETGMEFVNDEPYCPFCGSCSISKREIGNES